MASTQAQLQPTVAPTSPAPTIAGKKIIIIGAGIGGLSFALSLLKQWPSEHESRFPTLKIYERDTREIPIGREGYSLSIRGDAFSGGMQVLHKLGLLKKMLPLSVHGDAIERGTFNLWTTDWKSLISIRGSPGDKDLPAQSMRISRAVLRRVMVDEVCSRTGDQQNEDDDHGGKGDRLGVCWGMTCSNVEKLEEGRIRVHLTDAVTGEEKVVDECDLVIAADGASSKIRAQLRPADTLQFTGVVCISATSTFGEGEIPKPIHRDWGAVLGGGGVGLFVSPIDRKRALWSVSYMAEQPRQTLRHPLTEEQVQSLTQEALDRGQYFQEPFQTMVHASDPTTLTVFNAKDKQPFCHLHSEANSFPGVIFIGDANHAVSPFAGNGANMALIDGWELAEELCKAGTVSVALRRYDRRCVPRSTRTVNQSHWTISMIHASGMKLLVYRAILKLVGCLVNLKGT